LEHWLGLQKAIYKFGSSTRYHRDWKLKGRVNPLASQITTTNSIASEGLDLLNHSICSADEKTSTEIKQYTEILDISKDSAAQKCEWRPSKAHTKRKKNM